MHEHLTKALVGIIVTFFTAGAIWWASNVQGHLESIDHNIIEMARFQGGTEARLKEIERRLAKLEQ